MTDFGTPDGLLPADGWPITSGSRSAAPAVDVALVVPLSGPAGMFGPSCEASAELAVQDINAAGGVLDRPVRIHPVDAGAPLEELSATIDRLVSTGAIDAVVGWHLSDARRAITPYTAGRVPCVYTTFYEGDESSDGVYMVGETPRQQLFPAMTWLREHHGARRWSIVGNDYIWPRRTAAHTREFAGAHGLDILGESYVPLRSRNFGAAMDMLRDTGPDGVLVLMVGSDNAAFNRAFARAGLDEHHLRLAMMIGEDVLHASGPDATRGLFTASGFFESVVTSPSLSFGARWFGAVGASGPTLNNIGESCYEGVMLLGALADTARSLRVGDIARTSGSVGYSGPRGEVALRGSHTRQPVFLAESDVGAFSVVAQLA